MRLASIKIAIYFVVGILLGIPCFSSAQQLPAYQLVNRHCNCPEFEFKNGRFELKLLRESKNDVEIRLLSNHPNSYIAITVVRVKDNEISGNFYAKRLGIEPMEPPDSVMGVKHWERYPFYKFTLPADSLKKVFPELIYNNVLSLPDQQSLMDSLGNKNGFFLLNHILFKYYNHYRSYSFDYTEKLAEQYPGVHEFGDYVTIGNLLSHMTKNFLKQFFQLSSKDLPK